MIDINTNDSRITEIRYTRHKHFEFIVTIEAETHNLNISIVSEEDKQGEDTELIHIKIEDNQFSVTEDEDTGEKLNGYLGVWFDSKYPLFSTNITREDFDNIFSVVWGYLEKKDFY